MQLMHKFHVACLPASGRGRSDKGMRRLNVEIPLTQATSTICGINMPLSSVRRPLSEEEALAGSPKSTHYCRQHRIAPTCQRAEILRPRRKKY